MAKPFLEWDLRCAIRFAVLFPILLCGSTLAARAQISVLTQHNDNSRTGQNTNETILTPANVNAAQFQKLFAQPVDGQLYAQPLYVPNVTIPGKGVHNVVFVATEADSVYAFDADNNSGLNATPLWQITLLDPSHGAAPGATPVSSSDTGCNLIIPVQGITSTPVIDPASGTLYVEAESKENGNFVHRLHAIDIATGAEKSSGPVLITATVNGTGDGSIGGQLTFEGLTQLNRPGLLLSNGTVYIAYASNCDGAPFHGWLFGYDALTMAQKGVFVTTPNGGLGGIWMSGSGLAADSNGTIFTVTGNGSFDTRNVPATELGDSILKLSLNAGTFSLSDYFTPFDQGDLSDQDNDLGSGGVLLLPDQEGNYPHEFIQTSKAGNIYVLNRDQLTANNEHYCASDCGSTDPQILQELNGYIGGTWSMPAYWNNTLYIWGSWDALKAFPLSNGLLGTISSSSTATIFENGATPSISADGNSNGIVWAIVNDRDDGPAVLHAFDATDLSNEVYNSSQAPNLRDQAGPAVKFTVPSVANGKVYVGTATELDVFGLATNQSPAITSANSTTFSAGFPSIFVVTAAGFPTPTLTESGALPNGVIFDPTTGLLTGAPSDGTAGVYNITFVASNAVGTDAVQSFILTVSTVTPGPPNIASLIPPSGTVGSEIIIAGSNFGTQQGSSTISFNGIPASPTIWSDGFIVVPVPTRATTGNVVITVAGQPSNGVIFAVTSENSAASALVQHVSSSNSRGALAGYPFCYHFQLPNQTTAGNAVIVGFTFSNNPNPTVTDDQGDTYGMVENYFDAADGQSLGIAAAFNVAAGARNISICFDNYPGRYVQPMATEFANVIAVDGAGNGQSGSGTSVSAGSLTPSVNGDVIYQIAFSLSVTQSKFTAGSQDNIAWNLLSADLMDGWAGQYGVYNSSSAVNPTISLGTSDQWISVAILLQPGNSGSIPSGMRIVHLVHANIPFNVPAGGTGNAFPNPLSLQFPSSGNLLAAMIGGGNGIETVRSITDNNNNNWVQAGQTFTAPNHSVQAFYAGNASTSTDLGLTLNWTGSSGDYTILLYDVAGAATSPLDTSSGATGDQESTDGTLVMPYTLTPLQTGELVLAEAMWDFNTGTGLSSNNGTSFFDTNTVSGVSLSGPEPVDQNNGWGHSVNTSTSPITFTWPQVTGDLPAGNWVSMAVAFQPAAINSQQVAAPTFYPPAGSYSASQSVTISDATVGAQIYYTTDGSIPNQSSTLYTGAPIVINSTTTLQAIAAATGLNSSAVASGTYVLNGPPLAQPPSVHIDVPAAGATVSGTVGIWGWAVDTSAGGTAISSVQIKVDGTVVGTATYGSSRPDVCAAGTYPGCPNVGFSFSLDTSTLSVGTHTITVTATDSDATPDSTSSSVTVNVQAPPPSVHIDAPAPGATVWGNVGIWGWAVDASAGGTAISGVQINVDGTVVGNASYGSSRPDVCVAGAYSGCPNVGFSFSLDTSTLSVGTHTITATATDSDATPDSTSSSVTVNVQAPPPSVHIDAPGPGATVSGNVGIWGWAVDASAGGTAISSVQINVDGTVVGNASYGSSRADVCAAGTYSGCPNVGFFFSLDTSTLSAGTHSITATATDSDATPDTGSYSVTVNVQTTPRPTVHIDVPASGATVSGNVAIWGWAVDASAVGTAISSVQINVDGTVVGTASYGSSRPDVCAAGTYSGCPNVGFSFSLDTSTLSVGTHTITATAADSDATPDSGSFSISISVTR